MIQKLSDIVDFNPPRNLEKGSFAKFIEMAALSPNQRDLDYFESKEYKGAGSRFKNGDTLFARITPCLENGKTAKVNLFSPNEHAFGSTELIVLSAKDSLKDEDYIYYLTRLPAFRLYARSRMEGTSGRQRVAWQSLADFKFDFPESEIRAIAGILLKSLDDKIALNKKMNTTLEAMAQGLFKSWFVDFDPVKAKLAAVRCGRDPEKAAMAAIACKLIVPPGKPKPDNLEEKLPSAEAIDAAITSLEALSEEQMQSLKEKAAHFPSDFIESELGLIPKGWNISELDKFISISGGHAFKSKDYSEKGVFVLRTKNFKNGIAHREKDDVFLPKTFLESHKGFICEEFDYHLVMVGASIGKTGIIFPSMLPALRNQNMWCFRARESRYSKIFIKNLVDSISKNLLGYSSGSAREFFRKQDFRNYKSLIPKDEILNSFKQTTDSILFKQSKNFAETQLLIKLRDALLPKLLSGEISVASD